MSKRRTSLNFLERLDDMMNVLKYAIQEYASRGRPGDAAIWIDYTTTRHGLC